MFGLFIVIFIFLLYKLVPNSCNNNKIKEKFTNNTSNNTSNNSSNNTSNNKELEVKEEDNIIQKLPKHDENFMILTTFNDEKQISNNESRWYDDDIDKEKISLTDYNKGLYFTLNNTVSFEKDKLINAVKGANLLNVQMLGPVALYFSNKNISPYILSEFTLLFMLKFKEINGNATLFEMLCNTSVIDSKNNNRQPIYIPNIVSIDIIKSNTTQIHIEITFGSKKYSIPQIDKNLLINDNINLLGLVLNEKYLDFIINNKTYRFNLNDQETLTLGSQPIIINKFGELNIIMYSMAYYKKTLSSDDITDYVKYNQHYFTGMNKVILERLEYQKLLENAKSSVSKNEDKLKNMTKLLDKCVYKETDFQQISQEYSSSSNLDISFNKLDLLLPS